MAETAPGNTQNQRLRREEHAAANGAGYEQHIQSVDKASRDTESSPCAFQVPSRAFSDSCV